MISGNTIVRSLMCRFAKEQKQQCRQFSKCLQYVIASRKPPVVIPNVNLAAFVMKDWKSYGDKTAMVCSVTGSSYSYAQLTDAILQLSANLVRIGVLPGDVVYILSANSPEYSIVFLATTLIGAIATTNNPAYTADEISNSIKISGSKFMFTTPDLTPAVKKAYSLLGQHNPIKETFVIGWLDGYRSLFPLLTGDFYNTDCIPSFDWTAHVACIPFSSGTTGLPKGVMLTHHNIVSNIKQCTVGQGSAVVQSDTLAGLLPFYHIYGQVGSMLIALTHGATVVTIPKFDFTQFLKTLQERKITYCHLVPPIILGMLKSNLTNQYDLSALRIVTSGAAPLKASTSLEFQEKFQKLTICQGYGLTETSPVVTMNDVGVKNRHGSLGTLLANVQAKVVDIMTNKSVPVNQEGELYFCGPNIMKGYWRNQSATEECLDGSWFRTGDIGYYDKDGYFYVVDRFKELIKYKGLQVAPAELEATLIAHPDILDAAVVGAPCEVAGELPAAFIVTRSGSNVSDLDIHSYMSTKVSNHKQLRGGIHRISEIPKSASGKILRRLLKDKVAEKN